MRLCVCGGRNYFNREKVYDVLDYAYARKPFTLISGGASGADTLGIKWAIENGAAYEVFPANWKLHGRSAGPIRNLVMISHGIDVLIAFPGGRGTDHMVSECTKKGIKVLRVVDEKHQETNSEG